MSLIEEAPAIARGDWLPTNSGIDWLDSLGADHRRLLGEVSAMIQRRVQLEAHFKQEDEERREALELGFRTGRDVAVPAVTPEGDRQSLLNYADQERDAAAAALEGFANDAIRTIEEHALDWIGELADKREAAKQRKEEAQRRLDAADREIEHTLQLQHWAERNAGIHDRRSFRNILELRHIAWGEALNWQPPKPPKTDSLGNPVPELVETFDPVRHLEGINRGVTPPYHPSDAELEESERLRAGRPKTDPLPEAPESGGPDEFDQFGEDG